MPGQQLEPLAVVGISLRFPGEAVSPESFWQLILSGRSTGKEIPPDRYGIDAWHHPDYSQLDRVSQRKANFLEGDIGQFDAGFFSISAAEAEAMDPQQRLALETAYHALENAGYPIESITGSKMAVFTGAFSNDYQRLHAKDLMTLPKGHATGTSMNMLANRVSWFFNLRGPSSNVDTACSSSLMALHLACQSIWNGESSSGMAIGCNAILGLDTVLALDNLGILSKDGRSYSFDERGNGYARGEGVGALIVRPLRDAIKNGDNIRALIRSTGSNQDGKTPGITQPSMERQEDLYRDTYERAGLSLDVTRYVEGHGTGTAVGDPIEARAIGNIFRPYRSSDDPVYLGSVKSTIGHLEGASGVAGVIKAVLAVEKGIIPPNTDLQTLNPRIDEEFLHVKVPRKAIPWPVDGIRRASVSSFGFGGTNVHVVLDDAPSQLNVNGFTEQPYSNGTDLMPSRRLTRKPSGTARLLVWSSADKDGIPRLRDTWKPYFAGLQIASEERPEYLDRLSHTLSTRRSCLEWRAYAVVQLSCDWKTIPDSLTCPGQSISSPNLAYVFSGQGAQWYAMGRELLDAYPTFLNSIRDANAYLKTLGCQWDLLDALQKSEPESCVNLTDYSQTLCTALQVALVELLDQFGIVPRKVVGHSSGEIAAAYAVRAISRRDAWRIAFYRGLWSSKLENHSYVRGSMLAVALSADEVLAYLDRVTHNHVLLRLTVACINSPNSVTVSGEKSQIDDLKSLLEADQIFCRRLKVRVAYHSFQMHEIAGQYETSIGQMDEEPDEFHNHRPCMVSSVTGDWITSDVLRTPQYWATNLVSPVQFSKALAVACSSTVSPPEKLDGSHCRSLEVHHVVEVGPHSALQGPTKSILADMERSSVYYLSLLQRNVPATSTVLDVVGYLWASGYKVDLAAANQDRSTECKAEIPCLDNLPEYPFNHSKSYWHESQISRNIRMPRSGKHELLGTPDPAWNPHQPRWRHIIRTSTIPWVQDHQVNGTVVYPGAGMVLMAVEAGKQLCREGRQILSFDILDTALHSAIQVSGHGDVESSFSMHPVSSMRSKNSDFFEFGLYTALGSSWTTNCTGSIRINYSPEEADPVSNDQVDQLNNTHQHSLLRAEQQAASDADSSAIYDHLRKCGYHYGDSFQGITALAYDPQDTSTVVGDVHHRLIKAGSTLHPTALDAMFQMLLCANAACGKKEVPTYVPTHIKRLQVLKDGQPGPSERFKVLASANFDSSKEVTGSIAAFGANNRRPSVLVEGLTCTMVDGIRAISDDSTTAGSLCSEIEWKPDVRLLGNAEIEQYCQRNLPAALSKEILTELDFVVLARVLEAYRVFSEQKKQPAKPYLQKYIEWAVHQKDRLEHNEMLYSSEPWRSRLQDWKYVHDVESRLLVEAPFTKLLINVGQNLLDFLTGAVDPLEFFFTGNISDESFAGSMVDDFYAGTMAMANFAKAVPKFMDLMAHTNPGMNILEVGAGVGVATKACLEALGASGHASGSRYARWDYTDISRSFFGKAATKFGEEGSRMQFKKLDIEEDPEQQGFEAGSYDMIVAGWVVHATHSLERTLTNIRKLLKPGGKLLLAEVTNPFRTAAAFGLLEGWWLSSEPYRVYGPCVDRERWDDVLQKTGFTGCDVYFPDFQDSKLHEHAVFVSTASHDVAPIGWNPRIEIVYEPNEPKQHDLASSLKEKCQALVKSGVACVPVYNASPDSQDVLRVFLLDFEKQSLYNTGPTLYEKLRELFTASGTTLWVTKTSGLPAPDPRVHLIDGLFRVLAEEDGHQNRYVLSLEGSAERESVMAMIQHILKPPVQGLDTEYTMRDGTLHNPRLVNSARLEQQVLLQTATHTECEQSFGDVPLSLDLNSSSFSNGFRFIESGPTGDLGETEVELEIHCAGLNFRDVLISLGQIPNAEVWQEGAGVVTKVGKKCTRFKPGDRVAGFVPQPFQARTVFVEGNPVVHIPQGQSYAEAAGIPTSFLTAWFSLTEVARIKPGESVLIHSGAGGTGQALIQIALLYQAEIYTTVGTKEKQDFLKQRYPIPAERIFSSRSTDFASAIMQMTGGKGVDVVVNSLSGEGLVESWGCTSPYGRFVELGKKDILANAKLPMRQFLKNVTYSCFDLALLQQDRPHICRDALETVMSLMDQGKLSPQEPTHVYGVGEIEKAYRHMQSGKNFGKIVIEMRKSDIVKTLLKSKPNTDLDPDATYLVAGGLGGLGQSMLTWMVGRGARNLLLLSRSGEKGRETQEFLSYLRAEGANVQVRVCDVAEEDSLRAAIEDAASHMPPIKGCIQAAMVLQDVGFENMTYKDWETAVKPKAQGSWNLHNLLPRGLDFFLMLSSMNGVIGHVGQANYAAGNTFQDALAHHRVQCGENATSLDLGLFTFTGRVARDPRLLQIMLNVFPHQPITEPEFHTLLDVYCSPTVCKEKRLPCQLSFGMRPHEGTSTKAYWLGKPMFRYMAQQRSSEGHRERQGQSINLPAAFRGAESMADATAAVTKALTVKLARTLSVDEGSLDENKALHQYGVDSLVAVELRTWFSKEVQADVATFDIIGRATITSLAGVAASRSKLPRGWS
ncbi:type I Iterative Polyketide synthase (PKS) [Aspergillus tubingensis]|uniref:polyketide synthase n=1 Tax=Aspergillus tubingensis TaxID=5068 RepID=UPI001578D09B|nr:polyketide synthase [Aspergillus tubingensis]GFN16497.1 polyketide synthase [Aspergillus tubingensis]GLA61799.1 type I Iterative Polyketide synthase (PKS) [Aspergillus tubingensis]GLA69812.1 type I Iterative Polyketide synthase (PKS) [Aspergillus tubingensis]GLA92580.1 type I Iterative Polyketide synthase (PKS) [Aspergillus tubingensis]GLB16039.1 type I Iterative Polyketide synthase (PKS) [Aspergillus tubingensis]